MSWIFSMKFVPAERVKYAGAGEIHFVHEIPCGAMEIRKPLDILPLFCYNTVDPFVHLRGYASNNTELDHEVKYVY